MFGRNGGGERLRHFSGGRRRRRRRWREILMSFEGSREL